MTPIRNEKHKVIGYRQELPDGQVKIRGKYGELVGWTAFGQTRAKDERLVSFQKGTEAGSQSGRPGASSHQMHVTWEAVTCIW